jgi:(E)-4-hydroxy-3-methylbut-2-enyl-diphosphate synthase
MDGSTSRPAHDNIDPYHFTRRETSAIDLGPACKIGPEQPPRVIVRVLSIAELGATAQQLATPRLKDTPAEGLLVAINSPAALTQVNTAFRTGSAPSFLVLELAPSLQPGDLAGLAIPSPVQLMFLRQFGSADQQTFNAWTKFVRKFGYTLACKITPQDFPLFAETLRTLGSANLIFTLSSLPADGAAGHTVGAYRQLAEQLNTFGSSAPLWIRNTQATAVHGDASFLSRLLEASILTGSLLCDGLGDLISIETEPDPVRATTLAYNVLQGAGARISKTEFVACPSCGRTLFDLQTTTQRIREKTGHLKGVKLAIMGCIVNGPGEMADADFGYVGGAPGKINLYVGKSCVQYNIPQAEADDRLISLIKEHGKWAEPILHPDLV